MTPPSIQDGKERETIMYVKGRLKKVPELWIVPDEAVFSSIVNERVHAVGGAE